MKPKSLGVWDGSTTAGVGTIMPWNLSRKPWPLTNSLETREVRPTLFAALARFIITGARYKKAVEYYDKALTNYRDLKDPDGETDALQGLATVYAVWVQKDKALKNYEEALAIARSLKNPKKEADALYHIGGGYQGRGQYGKALEFCEEALALYRQLKNPHGEEISLRIIGTVYHILGQYTKALEFKEKSLEISQRLKDSQGQGYALNDIANLYDDWGAHYKSLEYYQQALEIRRNLKDRHGEGSTLLEMVSAYSQQGNLTEAMAQAQKGLEIYKELGVPTKWAQQQIGDLYLDMGELDKAEPVLQEADSPESLGRLYLLKLNHAKARDYYEKLRDTGEKDRSVYKLFPAYTGLGLAYEGLGDNISAEENYRKAVELSEDLRSSLTAKQRETFFDVKVGGFSRTAPYDGLARVRIKLNKPLEAFKDSEYTKSRIFAEAMSKWSESTSFDIPQETLTRDRELNDQLGVLKKKRQEAYEKANQEVIVVIEPQVKELEGKLQSHIKMLRDKYPLFAATKYPEPMGINQSALKENEWTLAYHVTDPGIIIYLTKGKNIVKVLFKPVPRYELNSLVLEFRKPLEVVPGKDNFDENLKSFDIVTGKKLSDLLLSDVLESIPNHIPILIVPDDCLGMLPFEVLVLNDKGTIKTDKSLPYILGAEFLGDRNLISYSQSVTALTLSRIHSKVKGAHTGLLAIADPVFDEKDDRTSKAPKKDAPTGVMASLYKRLSLMAAEESDQMGGLKFSRLKLTGELAKALSEMRKQGSAVYTGFNASKSNFMNKIAPKLNQCDEVLFATHGYFGKDLPGIMEPVLVLTLVPPGTDGFLRMTQAMGLNMNAEIVALTACQSGLGKRTAGEGTMGMGRAFQYAGAKSVLMSLWSVSEVASVNLVKSFFRNMKEGKGKS